MHKKSRKHKHKVKKPEIERIVNDDSDGPIDIILDDDDDDDDDDASVSASKVLTLKTSDYSSEKLISPKNGKNKIQKSKANNSGKKNTKKKDGAGEDDTDSEEERWLNAIESGNLEKVDDELKRIKNPRLMTARQRAILEKRFDGTEEALPVLPAEPLLSLPSGFKEKVLTEEMLAKKALKIQRRREQAQEKREVDKKKTVDRLLKKQDSKMARLARQKSNKRRSPCFSYLNNKDEISILVPKGYSFPLEPTGERDPPKPKLCGVPSCPNLKKYNCSKTGVPLCSLECYRKNLALKG